MPAAQEGTVKNVIIISSAGILFSVVCFNVFLPGMLLKTYSLFSFGLVTQLSKTEEDKKGT